jgi:hypothetical protein
VSEHELKDIPQTERELEYLYDKRAYFNSELKKMSGSGLSPQFEDDQRKLLQQQVENFGARCRAQLENLVAFPYWQIRHAALLKEFWKTGGYEESVFIMTKFPDKAQGKDKNDQLNRVLKAISDAVLACSCKPRIAQFPQNYHPGLWDNVELHLLGCKRGVAVVEDRYSPELNPNVMMEWGGCAAWAKESFSCGRRIFAISGRTLGTFLAKNLIGMIPSRRSRPRWKGF